MMKFNEQLKIYRKKLNYTQEKMAEFMGIGLKTYQSWEQGIRKPLKIYGKMLIEMIEKKLEGK